MKVGSKRSKISVSRPPTHDRITMAFHRPPQRPQPQLNASLLNQKPNHYQTKTITVDRKKTAATITTAAKSKPSIALKQTTEENDGRKITTNTPRIRFKKCRGCLQGETNDTKYSNYQSLLGSHYFSFTTLNVLDVTTIR